MSASPIAPGMQVSRATRDARPATISRSVSSSRAPTRCPTSRLNIRRSRSASQPCSPPIRDCPPSGWWATATLHRDARPTPGRASTGHSHNGSSGRPSTRRGCLPENRARRRQRDPRHGRLQQISAKKPIGRDQGGPSARRPGGSLVRWFADLPIERKLRVVIVLPALATFALALAMHSATDALHAHEVLNRKAARIAATAGVGTLAALSRNDRGTARRLLGELNVEAALRRVEVLDAAGRPVALF